METGHGKRLETLSGSGEAERRRLDLEPMGVQRRRFFFAALFSFGAVFAVMTLLRISPSAREYLSAQGASFLEGASIWVRAVISSALPLAALLFGFSPLGGVFLALAVFACGAAAGILTFLQAVSASFPPFSLLALLPFAASIIFFSASVQRLSSQLRRQVRSGGLYRPDLRPELLRAGVNLFLYYLTLYFCRALTH